MQIRNRFVSILLTALLLGSQSVLSADSQHDQSSSKVTPTHPGGMVRASEVEGVTEYRLANGLRVLLIPDSSVDTITVNVTYLVGSRQEGYGETGMAHLLEHLLFRGTQRHSDIKGEFQKRGARYNGSTSFDRTNYFETFPATQANLDWALELEADRMINSSVSRADLDAEMTVVRNEFESGENSAFNVLRERITSTAYLWHGYGRAVIGARSDIENVPIERLQAFYRLYYQPDNAAVVIAGRFDEPTALQSVQKHFGAISRPARSLPATYTVEPTQDGERTVTLKRTGDVQIIGALYHVPPGNHPDYAAIDVLVGLMSHVPSGRLHKALTEAGKASSIFGTERQQREAGFAYFGAILRQELPIGQARDTLLNALEGIAKAPFSDDEVERARTRLLNQIEMVISNSRSLALTLSETIALGDWRMLFVHRDRLRSVTTADVQRVANYYLKSSNRTLGMFLPTREIDRAEIPAPPDISETLANYRGQTAIAQGEGFDPTPKNIEQRTIRSVLPGGMKLALLPKKTRGNTVVALLNLHWGNEQSKSGRATACGIASAMLLRGTQKRNREQIANEFSRLKASVGVSGEGGSIETVRENLPTALRLVSEVLRQPSFPAAEFEQLRQSSLAGIEIQRSDPAALADLELSRHLNPYPENHWYYSTTPAERIARLNALAIDDVRQCHHDFFGASDSELVIVGDFDAGEIAKLANELFGDWTSPVPYARVPTTFVQAPPLDRIISTPDKANAVFRAGQNLQIRDDHPDYPALVLGNYLLGGSSTARLSQRIREQEGLSYSVSSSLAVSSFDPKAVFAISAIHAPQNGARLETAVREELRRALTTGFDEQEVESAKKGFLQSRQVARNQDGLVAARLGLYLQLDRTFAWDEQLDARIAGLSARDINETLLRYLDLQKLSVVRAGDFRPTDASRSESK